MSTKYYTLQHPITRLEVNYFPNTDLVQVWVGGEFSGTLIVPKDTASSLVRMFADDDMYPPAAHTSWGGDATGMRVTVYETYQPDDLQIISDYGGLTTIGELKAEAGRGKKE